MIGSHQYLEISTIRGYADLNVTTRSSEKREHSVVNHLLKVTLRLTSQMVNYTPIKVMVDLVPKLRLLSATTLPLMVRWDVEIKYSAT